MTPSFFSSKLLKTGSGSGITVRCFRSSTGQLLPVPPEPAPVIHPPLHRGAPASHNDVYEKQYEDDRYQRYEATIIHDTMAIVYLMSIISTPLWSAALKAK